MTNSDKQKSGSQSRTLIFLVDWKHHFHQISFIHTRIVIFIIQVTNSFCCFLPEALAVVALVKSIRWDKGNRLMWHLNCQSKWSSKNKICTVGITKTIYSPINMGKCATPGASPGSHGGVCHVHEDSMGHTPCTRWGHTLRQYGSHPMHSVGSHLNFKLSTI